MNDATQEHARDYDPHSVRIRDHGRGSICTTIVRTIADRADLEPTDMEPLHCRIDTELIERLCRGGREVSGEVMFNYHGFRVTVTSDRQIVVAPITADATAPEGDGIENAD